MKPIAVFVLVAVFSLATVAASAKVTSATQNDNDRVMQGVAGPPSNSDKSMASNTTTAQPSKQALKKAKVKSKPGLNNPN